MNEPSTPNDRIELQLELEVGAKPISGRLADRDGNAWEFVGWLGLGAVLEELLGDRPGGEAPSAP